MDERVERARLRYEQAVFGGDPSGLPAAERELDAVEADLALARGRILHAWFLETRRQDTPELPFFERAAQLYRDLGDVRGEAESLLWVAAFHQVVRNDNDAAVPALERSLELATRVGDALTASYALRHLGIAEHAAGRLSTARERLEASTRFRREVGFLPGVAANLIGLGYIAAQQGRRDDAQAIFLEAERIAEASGADGIVRSVEEARRQLSRAGQDH